MIGRIIPRINGGDVQPPPMIPLPEDFGDGNPGADPAIPEAPKIEAPKVEVPKPKPPASVLQTNETKKLKAQIKELTEKYNSLLAEHEKLKTELSKAEKALAECTEARKRLQAELDALKNVKPDDSQIKELQRQIDTYKQSIDKISIALAEKNKIITDTQSQLNEKITIIKGYDEKFKAEQEFNSTLKVEIEKLKSEIGVLKEKGEDTPVEVDKPATQGGLDFTDIVAMLWMIGNWVLIIAGCIIFLFGLNKLWNWLILLWKKFKDKRKVQPVQVVDDQCCEDLTKDFDQFKTQIMNKIDLLSKNIQDSIHDTDIGPQIPDLEQHPDYREPPEPIVLPKYNPTDEPQLYPRVPSRNVPPQRKVNVDTKAPPVTRGYGPVPPKMPTREFTVDQVFEAIDEVSRRHSMDDRLCTVSQLVRQILQEPKRNVTN